MNPVYLFFVNRILIKLEICFNVLKFDEEEKDD